MFLSRKEMWDRPMIDVPGKKRVTHWAGNFLYGSVALICKVAFRYKVKGRENLRAFEGKSGVVVVCNHTSYLDVAFVYLAGRPNQWTRLMGRESLFNNAGGFAGQILSRVGAFPVKRDSADRTSIKRAVRMLKDGEVVGIMPEGTRRGKSNKTPSVHGGAALIAKMADVPIIPMTVRNAEKIKEKGKCLKFPQVTVQYSTPLVLADFDFLPKHDRLEGATWYALRECFSMFMEVPPEEVDMVALFPDGHDFTEAFANHVIPKHDPVECANEFAAKKAKKARAKTKAKEAKAAVETQPAGEPAEAAGEQAANEPTESKEAAGETAGEPAEAVKVAESAEAAGEQAASETAEAATEATEATKEEK